MEFTLKILGAKHSDAKQARIIEYICRYSRWSMSKSLLPNTPHNFPRTLTYSRRKLHALLCPVLPRAWYWPGLRKNLWTLIHVPAYLLLLHVDVCLFGSPVTSHQFTTELTQIFCPRTQVLPPFKWTMNWLPHHSDSDCTTHVHFLSLCHTTCTTGWISKTLRSYYTSWELLFCKRRSD